jgi:hypothetical protein
MFKLTQMDIIELFKKLHYHETCFRFENDDDGYWLTIIDRSKYPRLWVDNFHDRQEAVIAESIDNLIEKTMLTEKDWQVRFFGETIEECIAEYEKWQVGNK